MACGCAEACELVGQNLVEFLAVVQAREAVGNGEFFQQLILLLQGSVRPDLGVAPSQPIDHHIEDARQVADLACRCTAQVNAKSPRAIPSAAAVRLLSGVTMERPIQ
jgi:hypothetical protein